MKPESALHLQRAAELLDACQYLLKAGFYADSITRAYYGMFHASKAVLLDLDIERKSHRSHWAAFAEHVTKQGRMDNRFHRYGISAFSARSGSDYLPEPKVPREEAEIQLTRAREFVSACQVFLGDQD